MTAFKPIIEKVVNNNMCIACGSCIYACPHNIIYPSYNRHHESWGVSFIESDICKTCPHPCDRVCPSISVNFNYLLTFKQEQENTLQNQTEEQYYTGYSSQFGNNGISSSGGVIRSLIYQNISDGVPVVCLTNINNNYSIAAIKDINQITSVPGSIYHSISFHQSIGLIKESSRPVVLVSTPCQLEGIYNYIYYLDTSLYKKIHLAVGLICGWMYSMHAIHAFCSYKKIKEEPTLISYRGEDKVGLLKIKTKDNFFSFNRRKFKSFKEMIDYSAAFSRKFNILRCRVCENHLNVLADISVGDAWLKRKKNEKESIIIVRSKKGKEIIQSMVNHDLYIEKADFNDIIESQSANLVYNYNAYAFSEYLRKKKVVTPSYKHRDIISKKEKKTFIKFSYEMIIRKYIINKRLYSIYKISYVSENLFDYILKQLLRFLRISHE